MKYQSLLSFEKHLAEAAPSHLSPAYMVACPAEFERKRLFEKILLFLKKKDPTADLLSFDAHEGSLDQVLEHLNTAPLFTRCSFILFDNIEKLKKQDLERLSRYLASPSPSSHLILGCGSLKTLGEIYLKGKKELVLLDLCDEKPWERQKRLKEWLIVESRMMKKSLSQEAASLLLDQLGGDMAALHQELIKLVCFVGERPTVERADVEAISSSRALMTGWQIAEKAIWGSKGEKLDTITDLSALLALVGQLRYQLQIGLKIATLLQSGVAREKMADYLGSLKGNTLEKYLPLAKQRGIAYFRDGLLHLFDLEMKCKSTSLDAALLFDHFILKLHHTYAPAST